MAPAIPLDTLSTTELQDLEQRLKAYQAARLRRETAQAALAQVRLELTHQQAVAASLHALQAALAAAEAAGVAIAWPGGVISAKPKRPAPPNPSRKAKELPLPPGVQAAPPADPAQPIAEARRENSGAATAPTLPVLQWAGRYYAVSGIQKRMPVFVACRADQLVAPPQGAQVFDDPQAFTGAVMRLAPAQLTSLTGGTVIYLARPGQETAFAEIAPSLALSDYEVTGRLPSDAAPLAVVFEPIPPAPVASVPTATLDTGEIIVRYQSGDKKLDAGGPVGSGEWTALDADAAGFLSGGGDRLRAAVLTLTEDQAQAESEFAVLALVSGGLQPPALAELAERAVPRQARPEVGQTYVLTAGKARLMARVLAVAFGADGYFDRLELALMAGLDEAAPLADTLPALVVVADSSVASLADMPEADAQALAANMAPVKLTFTEPEPPPAVESLSEPITPITASNPPDELPASTPESEAAHPAPESEDALVTPVAVTEMSDEV